MEPGFEIKKEGGNGSFARFVVTPLAQGYGHTLGNSLRRVLLNYIEGAAIVSLKIAGVRHQFATIKGVKEDVVDIILNLKSVRFALPKRGSGKEATFKGEISKKGPGEVKASDIKVSGGLKVVNGDCLIATLAKGSSFSADVTIASGTGYVPAKDRQISEVGVIPTDAAFSPVTRVNYKVEETRVGRLTNYDKLVLEITTDGSLDPGKALTEAATLLISYFEQIVSPKRKAVKEVQNPATSLGLVGKLSVEEIGLPTRIANALVKSGYETVENLVSAKRENLVKVRNLGEKSLKVIFLALGGKGIKPDWA